MKHQMPPDIPLAIVIFATVTMVSLRAAGRGATVTAGLPDAARRAMAAPPGTPGGEPGRSADQMHDVFHELHAEGRHALCTVCDSQYGLPA